MKSVEPDWIQADLAPAVTLYASRRLTAGIEPTPGSSLNLWVKPHAIRVIGTRSGKSQPSEADLAAAKSVQRALLQSGDGAETESSRDLVKKDRLNSLQATVVHVNYQGFLTEYILQTVTNARLRATRVNTLGGGADGAGVAICQPGEKVMCYFLASDCSFFSSESRALVPAGV